MSDKINRLPQVIELTGKARSTIYDDVKNGRFPRPIKLGANSVGWLQSELDAWMESQKALRDTAGR